MKKRIFSILLCICMVCSLLPVTAMAGADDRVDKVKVAGTELTTTGFYSVSNLNTKLDAAPEAPNNTNYVHWNSSTGTLTLYNATINGGNSSSGIYANGNFTIILAESTNNTVVSEFTNAITCDSGSVTIKGPGTLQATGATNGICVAYAVTIAESANINVTGTGGCGIIHYPTVFSWENDPVSIDATVTASITGSTYGICNRDDKGGGSPILNSPKVTIKGETAAFDEFPHGAPTLGTGIGADASGDFNGSGPVEYSSGSYSTYKWFQTYASATAPTVTKGENLGLTYGYDAGSISVTAEAIADHTLSYQWYSCNADGSNGESISENATNASYTIPTGKNAGTYYYYCAVTSERTDNNRTATTNSDVITVTVAPATLTVEGTGTASGTYGTKLSELSVSGLTVKLGESTVAGAWAFSGETVLDVGTSAAQTATFTPATGAGNYNTLTQNIVPTITKAPYTGETSTNGSAKYGTAGTVDLTSLIVDGGTAAYDSSSSTDSNSVLNGTPAIAADGTTLNFAFVDDSGKVSNTAALVVKVTSNNYEDYTITITVTVNDKITPTVTAPTAKTGLIYNGNAQTLINEGSTNGGTLQYSLTSGSGYSAELPKATNAGSYTVYYKIVGNDDYADVAENSVTVTIATKAVTAAPKNVTITKGSAIPAFELVYTGLVGSDTLALSETPAFTCFEADGTTPVSTGTAAGTYTITWTNMDSTTFTTTDYAVSKTATSTLTINNPAPSGGGWYDYDYTPPSYKVEDVTPNKADGSITSDHTNAQKGDDVTITVTPDRYYNVDGVIVKDKNGKEIPVTMNQDGTFSFEMPAGEVTVEPIFVWDNPFVDVDEETEDAEPVEWALKNGITTGATDTTFAPDGDCTRAQIVTFLWRAAGSPEPTGTAQSFADVDADDYFAKAVLWALENGITTGVTDTTFAPDAVCTRAQTVTFLHRAAGKPATEQGSAFDDVTADSYYAQAVAWAEANGITKGIGGSLFGSLDECTRIQIVTFLYRFLGELTD